MTGRKASKSSDGHNDAAWERRRDANPCHTCVYLLRGASAKFGTLKRVRVLPLPGGAGSELG